MNNYCKIIVSMPAEWNRIRNRYNAINDIRVGRNSQINVYYDKLQNGKCIRISIGCNDVRLAQGTKVSVYCDKYVKVGV